MSERCSVFQVAESAIAIGIAYAETCIKQGLTTYGNVEEMAELARAAEYLETLYCNLPQEVQDNAPGVWAYEVAAEVGAIMASEGFEGIEPKIKTIVDKFFDIDLPREGG